MNNSLDAPRPATWRQFGFRILASYFFLYVASVAVVLNTPGMLFASIVPWFGHVVLGIDAGISVAVGPSGDTLAFWVQFALMLAVAPLLAVVWTLIDRTGRHDGLALDLLKSLLRYTLALTLMGYGANKLRQFPPLSLSVLIVPFGQFSLESVLWTFMMTSPAYSMFAGCVEMAGALLLLPRRTATLGALVCAGAMANVVMLNIAYDVPVKLLSSHLLLMASFLVAMDARRLLDMFLFNRATAPAPLDRTWTRPWKRVAMAAKAVLVIAVLSRGAQKLYLGIASRMEVVKPSPLYGIWDVETFTADGQILPPLRTDPTRWQRIVVSGPSYLTVEAGGDEGSFFGIQLNEAEHAVTLNTLTRSGPKPAGLLKYSRVAPDLLTLDGSIEGRTIAVQLRRVDEDSFPLRKSRFHWVTDQRPMR